MTVEVEGAYRVTGHPPQEAWMERLVGLIGRALVVREIAGGKVTAVQLHVPGVGAVWLSARYLEPAPEEELEPDAVQDEDDGEEMLF